MVDVFGGTRVARARSGPPGPRGLRGLPGSIRDFCTWLPNTILKNLQEHEETDTYFIRDPKVDLHYKGDPGDITRWLSRSSGGGWMDADRPSKGLTKLNDYYALDFMKTRYTVDDGYLMHTRPGTGGFICITFRMSGEGEQVLVTDHADDRNDYCEIRATETDLILHLRGDDEVIQRNCREWTTAYIEYNCDKTMMYFKYNVNGVTGSFTRPIRRGAIEVYSMGSRTDDTHFLEGSIAALEIYRVDQSSEIPGEWQKIIVKNQQDLYS